MKKAEAEEVEGVIYLDTSAVLRAVMEYGASPGIDRTIGSARYLITSRLSLLESARALHRLRARGVAEQDIADMAHEIDAIWSRCTIWEINRDIIRIAEDVAPHTTLRALDAIHLATFVKARRAIGSEMQLLTGDHRLEMAAKSSSFL